MLRESPLRKHLAGWPRRRVPDPEAASHRPGAAQGSQTEPPEIVYLDYAGGGDGLTGGCELVATFGDLESEYAAVRRGAGILDSPHRATIVVTGADRRDFLNRMLTQELKTLDAGGVYRSFWLNRRGRILADLLLAELGDRLLLDLDVHGAQEAVASLSEFLVAEDVEIKDAGESLHHLAMHGPQAPAVIAAATGTPGVPLEGACELRIGGVEVVAIPVDQTGGAGFELIMPGHEAEAVWDALLAAGEAIGQGRRVRPVGWHAFNIARIEAGTPLYNIDFGPENLPHESGVLRERVSFTKGCYLGQEIVARTENLGKPKQQLVGLRPVRDLLPEAGTEVLADGKPVGVVTSSTLSPMLGSAPIAFAMLRSQAGAVGTTVQLEAEGEQTEAVVGALRFYEAPSP